MAARLQKLLDMAHETRDDIEYYSMIKFGIFERNPELIVRPEENMPATFDELIQQLWGYIQVIQERLNTIRQNANVNAGSIDAIMLYLHDSYDILLEIFRKTDFLLNRELGNIREEINTIHNNNDALLDLKMLILEIEYKILENRDRKLVIRKTQWENEVKLARRALLVGSRLTNQFIEISRSQGINAEQVLSMLDNQERYFSSEQQIISQKQEELEVRRREIQEMLRAREEELRRLNANTPKDIWKGWSKSDIENLNSVFDTEEVELGGRTYREMYAACPVCLAYVDRGEGCIYIQGHNCKEEAERRGDLLYHRQLYHKYKTETGNIIFCSICSRICQNEPEAHLTLVEHNSRRAEKTGRNSDPFARGEAGCTGAGGGGFNEKAIRFNAIRNTAFNLTGQIGKITKYQAFKEIVETAWDAPLNDFRFLQIGKFNRPNNAFPAMLSPETISKKVIPRNGFLSPTILMEGTNTVAYIDDPPLIQFHHLDARGHMNNHEEQIIGPAGLLGWIQHDHNHPQKCFSSACGGYLYPQEITMALNAKKADGSPYFKLENADKKIIQQYTKKFYENLVLSEKVPTNANNIPSLNGFFSEDNSESMFHMATNATCRVRGGKRRRIKTRRMNKRRLQRKTRK